MRRPFKRNGSDGAVNKRFLGAAEIVAALHEVAKLAADSGAKVALAGGCASGCGQGAQGGPEAPGGFAGQGLCKLRCRGTVAQGHRERVAAHCVH